MPPRESAPTASVWESRPSPHARTRGPAHKPPHDASGASDAHMADMLGEFTTHSAFGYEAFALLASGARIAASLDVPATSALGLLNVVAGHPLAKTRL